MIYDESGGGMATTAMRVMTAAQLVRVHARGLGKTPLKDDAGVNCGNGLWRAGTGFVTAGDFLRKRSGFYTADGWCLD